MGGQRALGVAAYTGQNLVCRLGPNERRGILIVDLNVFADGPFQFLHAAKHAAANPFVGECGEPSLDQVQPRTVGRREVNMKPRALGQPMADERRFVCAVVVQNEMDVEPGRHL